MNYKKKLLITICHLFFCAGVYIFFVLPVIKSVTIYPAHDNLERHLTNYLYFANSLKYGFGIPLWYPFDGGLPIGITSAFMFSLLPHRLLGYLLYAVFPVEPVTLYKINLVCGMLIISTGWWLFLRKLTKSRPAATIGTLMLLLSGSGITIFHQEQILATMTWLPWLLLSLLKVKEDSRFIMPAAILAGFCINLHNPHNQVIFFLFLFLSLLLTGQVFRFIHDLIKQNKLHYLFLSSVLFVLAASPALYVTKTQSSFSAPHRGYEEIKASNFQEYIRLNKAQASSATTEYLKNYIQPQTDVIDDQYAFFVTRTGIGLAAIGLILAFKASICVTIILLLCLWATLGINGQFAQVLYLIKFPFITYFRQWYHFVPMLNFCLCALGAIGAAKILSFFSTTIPSGKKTLHIILAGTLTVCVCFAMYYESKHYFTTYTKKHLRTITKDLPKLNKNEFLQILQQDWFSRGWMETAIGAALPADVPPIVVYKDWYKMSLRNPRETTTMPFSIKGNPIEKYFYPKEDYTVTPNGISLKGYAQKNSLTVFPFAYKLGLKAYLNGERSKTVPVYEQAMTGIIIPEGNFHLSLLSPISFYQGTLLIQGALLIFILIFSLKNLRQTK